LPFVVDMVSPSARLPVTRRRRLIAPALTGAQRPLAAPGAAVATGPPLTSPEHLAAPDATFGRLWRRQAVPQTPHALATGGRTAALGRAATPEHAAAPGASRVPGSHRFGHHAWIAVSRHGDRRRWHPRHDGLAETTLKLRQAFAAHRVGDRLRLPAHAGFQQLRFGRCDTHGDERLRFVGVGHWHLHSEGRQAARASRQGSRTGGFQAHRRAAQSGRLWRRSLHRPPCRALAAPRR